MHKLKQVKFLCAAMGIKGAQDEASQHFVCPMIVHVHWLKHLKFSFVPQTQYENRTHRQGNGRIYPRNTPEESVRAQ